MSMGYAKTNRRPACSTGRRQRWGDFGKITLPLIIPQQRELSSVETKIVQIPVSKTKRGNVTVYKPKKPTNTWKGGDGK